MSKVKDRAERIVGHIERERIIAEDKLEAAKPALQEAEDALCTIKPANIATVRKLGRPPHLIMRVMDCVIILFRKKVRHDPFWRENSGKMFFPKMEFRHFSWMCMTHPTQAVQLECNLN